MGTANQARSEDAFTAPAEDRGRSSQEPASGSSLGGLGSENPPQNLQGSFSNTPGDIKSLSGVQLKVGLKTNIAFRSKGSAVTPPEGRGKPRHGVLQQLSARKVQQLTPCLFSHPGLRSRSTDCPFHLLLCPAETPPGQPPAHLCTALAANRGGGKKPTTPPPPPSMPGHPL